MAIWMEIPKLLVEHLLADQHLRYGIITDPDSLMHRLSCHEQVVPGPQWLTDGMKGQNLKGPYQFPTHNPQLPTMGH